MKFIEDLSELGAIYEEPAEASIVKETSHFIPHYAEFVKASPFCMLSTVGSEGMDCSPRGDMPGFMRIEDKSTLLIPDRRGNNRIDSIRNIVENGKVALCLLVPGIKYSLRINGRAKITADKDMRASFSAHGKEPRSVIVVKVQSIFFQCGRAVMRSEIWNSDKHANPAELPTPGSVLQYLSDHQIDGEAYDGAWENRAKETLW